MASIFKAAGAKKYTIVYTDKDGKRRKKAGYTDKKESERLANQLEERARQIRDGLIDESAERYRDYLREPIAVHLNAWISDMEAKACVERHRSLFATRAKRVIALV